ncbi:hypothetical protein ACFQ34_08405 [Pseudonocardia benzenivorans]|uniref:Uncharacterized protein n=1 Tax=Pseudonocardia benzenivorans TaxID=228005 RepID=A0ABW3VGT1_9PSEU|nr:hypothetical protein PSD17_51040 [Pseudonocardia sp. D17]
MFKSTCPSKSGHDKWNDGGGYGGKNHDKYDDKWGGYGGGKHHDKYEDKWGCHDSRSDHYENDKWDCDSKYDRNDKWDDDKWGCHDDKYSHCNS